MTDDRAYNRLIDWFRQARAFVPPSEHLLPLMKAAYTADEAQFLTGIPLTLTPVHVLAGIKKEDPDAMTEKLDALARRGFLYRQEREGRLEFRLNPPRFVFLRSFFWPGRRDAYSQAVAAHLTRYYRDGFGDHWKDVATKGLRAIPVRQTLSDTRSIRPYEDVLAVLDRQERFAVAHCPCREMKTLDPDAPGCGHDTENCLHFGNLADYIIENGLGREISRSECHAILQKAAKAGLVHAVSNWQENVDTICNCCRCCCVYFQAFHVLGHAQSMSPSNYEVRLNPETCLGCGKCVARCPMGALSLADHAAAVGKTGKISRLDRHRCIGCGVCAYGCPTQSLQMFPRTPATHPPADIFELEKRYAAERADSRKRAGLRAAGEADFVGDFSSGEILQGR